MIRHPALTAVPRHRRAAVESRVRAGLRRVGARWRAHRQAKVAAGYERVVRTAERAPASLSSRVPVRCAAVRSARPELLAIAELLRSERRLPRAGVVAARRLLCDGNGPLYVDGDLGAALRHVLDLLGGGQPL